MTVAEAKLRELGINLPDLAAEATDDDIYGSRLVSYRHKNNVLYLAGSIPWRDGAPVNPGVLGKDLTVEQGYEAARWAMIAALATMKLALGDLDRFDHILQLTGFVSSAPGFIDQPKVINGASDLIIAVYGDGGLAARAAIGSMGLVMNSSVELVMTVAYTGEGIREPLEKSTPRSGGE